MSFDSSAISKALTGLSGDIVNAIAPHTEADPAALLSQLLTAFGNVVGRSPHFVAEADRHGTNLFVLNVGNTSKGRKGTSWGQIEKIFKLAAPEWIKNNICNGLVSGEGLIWRIRDAENSESSIEILKPDLVNTHDKRLLCFESEFASVLKSSGRKENTLSPILRQAWDSKNLQTLAKNQDAKSTEPHVSIIGHITKMELNSLVNQNDIYGGLNNRFLFFYVQRSKLLPDGGNLSIQEVKSMSDELSASIEFAKSCNELKKDSKSRELWHSVYPELSDGKPGIVGAMLARSEPQVLRLSLILSLMDRKNYISLESLESALEIHRYCTESIKYIFGDSLGNPIADTILELLEAEPNGYTRTQIRDYFKRNYSRSVISPALQLLVDIGKIFVTKINSGGRYIELWKSVKFADKANDINDISLNEKFRESHLSLKSFDLESV